MGSHVSFLKSVLPTYASPRLTTATITSAGGIGCPTACKAVLFELHLEGGGSVAMVTTGERWGWGQAI